MHAGMRASPETNAPGRIFPGAPGPLWPYHDPCRVQPCEITPFSGDFLRYGLTFPRSRAGGTDTRVSDAASLDESVHGRKMPSNMSWSSSTVIVCPYQF